MQLARTIQKDYFYFYPHATSFNLPLNSSIIFLATSTFKANKGTFSQGGRGRIKES